MNDCYFDDHLDAYKIYNSKNFEWQKVEEKEIHDYFITNTHSLADGFNYVSKIWM